MSLSQSPVNRLGLSTLIREATTADIRARAEVTVAAFESLKISNHTEQYIIAALRSAGALTLSLVAELDGQVVGHIAFSPVSISDGSDDWYGRGPVFVRSAVQQQGIGKSLIREGLSRLEAQGVRGCCLVGHPEYDRKFGFENVPGLLVEGLPPEFFFALLFDGHLPQGAVNFHEAFSEGVWAEPIRGGKPKGEGSQREREAKGREAKGRGREGNQRDTHHKLPKGHCF